MMVMPIFLVLFLVIYAILKSSWGTPTKEVAPDPDYVDPFGTDLGAIIARAQDRFKPPHERWRWVYRVPWIMRGNNNLYALIVPLGVLFLIWMVAA